MNVLAPTTDVKMEKIERSELSERLEITSPSGTRNTAGMTSEGCFVEFVLEHDPSIAASYVTCGLCTRASSPWQSIEEVFGACVVALNRVEG